MAVNSLLKEYSKDIYELTINGEPWHQVHIKIFGTKPHEFFSNFFDESLEEEFTRVELSRAKNYVMQKLAYKACCTYELRRELKELLVSDEPIRKILEECQAFGYIDDDDYIAAFIRRQRDRRHGPKMIAQKLRLKGIPQEKIEEALARDNEDEDLDQEQIIQLLETRFRNRDLSDFKEKQKVVGALMRKGYDLDAIYQGIDKMCASDR